MADRVGQKIGNYRLVRLLGEGGFAEVYLAEHTYLGSSAAIKLLSVRIAQEDIEQFQQEGRMLATLEHPHIVRVLDFGLEDRTPYLVMAYAPGGTLRTRHPKGSRLPLPTIVSYVKQIAQALQYAHDHKFIHRDIKPENMLISRDGTILLSDFGIAVLSRTERSSLNSFVATGGTPYYMAPELFVGKPRTASDQYSLGVVVYEWLCGTLPFAEGNAIQLGFQHTYQPVPLLREQLPTLSPAIEQVVMIALAKQPEERFGSVRAFATALEQAGQVEASQTLPAAQSIQHSTAMMLSPSQPLTELITRPSEPSIPSEPAASFIQTSLPTASTPPTSQPSSLPPKAVTHPPPLEQFTEMPLPPVLTPAPQEVASSPSSPAQPSSQSVVDQEPDEEPAYQPIAGRVVDYDQNQLVQGKVLTIFYQGFLSSSNQVYLHWGKNSWQEVVPSDEPMGKRLDGFWRTRMTIPIDATQINLAFHDDSGRWDNNGGKNWNLAIRTPPGTVLSTYRGHSGPGVAPQSQPFPPTELAIPPNRTLEPTVAAASTEDRVIRTEAAEGKPALTIDTMLRYHLEHEGNWSALAWSQDGVYIATGLTEGGMQLWDIRSRTLVRTCKTTNGTLVTRIAWAPDGQYITSASHDGTVQVWDASTGQHLVTYTGHKGRVMAVAWAPDGRRIASSAEARLEQYGTVQLWEASTGQRLVTYPCSRDTVTTIAWAPDGRRIALVSGDEVQLWDTGTGLRLITHERRWSTKKIEAVAWAPNGRHIALVFKDGEVEVREADTEHLVTSTDQPGALAWAPDGRHIASLTLRGDVQVWDTGIGLRPVTYVGHKEKIEIVAVIVWAPDGRRIASASHDGTVQVWEANTGQHLVTYTGHKGRVVAVAWAPDGRRIASTSEGSFWNKSKTVQVWDASTGQHLVTYTGHKGYVAAVAWAPDGRRIASASHDGTVQVWDASTGQHLVTYTGHNVTYRGYKGRVVAVAWAPDGWRIASASHHDGKVEVWEASSGQDLVTYYRDEKSVRVIAWAPDGRHIALVCDDGEVEVWEANTGRSILPYADRYGHTKSVAWAPDGQHIASVSRDGEVKVREANLRNSVTYTYQGRVGAIAWALDGWRIALASDDGTVQVW